MIDQDVEVRRSETNLLHTCTMAHAMTMNGIHRLGLTFFRIKFEGTSNTARAELELVRRCTLEIVSRAGTHRHK